MSVSMQKKSLVLRYFEWISLQLAVSAFFVLATFVCKYIKLSFFHITRNVDVFSTYYVVNNHYQEIWYLFAVWHILVLAVLLMDTSFCARAAFSKSGYFLSWTGIFDVLSLLPFIAFVSVNVETANMLGFLWCFRLIKIMRVVSAHPVVFQYFQDRVAFQVLNLGISIFVLLLVSTGMVASLSHFVPDTFYQASINRGFLLWHESFYFVVVTITTVGYGDIYPDSAGSRMLMVLIILVNFAIVPTLASSLIQAFVSRAKYSDSLKLPSGYKHVAVCGIVNSAILNQILLELSSGSLSCSMILVAILSPVPPSPRVKAMLYGTEKYNRRIKYLVGSSKVAADLKRIRLEDAIAVFALSDEQTNSMRVEEDSTFLSTISISLYIDNISISRSYSRLSEEYYHRPRVMTMLCHAAKLRSVLEGAGVDIVLPLQEFKYNLMGIGAALPGLLALFMKLNRPNYWAELSPSANVFARPESGDVNSLYQIDVSCRSHRPESESGASKYLTEANKYFDDLIILCGEVHFTTLALWIFHFSKGTQILIGVMAVTAVCQNRSTSGIRQQRSKVVLNPGSHVVLGACDALFVIGPSRLSVLRTITEVCEKFLSGDDLPYIEGHEQPPSSAWCGGAGEGRGHGGVELWGHGTSEDMKMGDANFIAELLREEEKTLNQQVEQETGSSEDYNAGHRPLSVICGSITGEEEDEGEADTDTPLKESEKDTHLGEVVPLSPAPGEHETGSLHEKKSTEESPPLSVVSDMQHQATPLQHPALSVRRVSSPMLKGYGVTPDSSRHIAKGDRKACDSSSVLVEGGERKKKTTARKKVYTRNRQSRCSRLGSVRLKKLCPFSPLIVDDTGATVSANLLTSSSCSSSDDIVSARTGSLFSFPAGQELSGSGDILHTKLRRLHNHLVIILASSGSKETVTAHALVMMIVFFMRSYRAYSPVDDVIVLSERADELSAISIDVSQSIPGLFDHNVLFYMGFPRNIDHLRLCGVTTARAVVILHHPTPSIVSTVGDDDPLLWGPSRLNADRHTIIVSLNLHFILQGGREGHAVEVTRTDRAHKTFTLAEISHEVNISYLRRSFSTILQQEPTVHTTNDGVLVGARDIGSVESGVDIEREVHPTTNMLLYDWNLVSAGCVLTHSVLDSLLLQSLQNPDVVSFWVALLDYHKSVSPQSSLSPQAASKESTPTPAVLLHHRRDSSSVNVFTLARFESVQNSRVFARPVSSRNPSLTNIGRGNERSERQTPPDFTFTPAETASSSPLLRVKCPTACVGKSFGYFFTECMLSYNIIPIGVYRYHGYHDDGEDIEGPHDSSSKGILPFLSIAPGHEFIIGEEDYVFALNYSSPPTGGRRTV